MAVEDYRRKDYVTETGIHTSRKPKRNIFGMTEFYPSIIVRALISQPVVGRFGSLSNLFSASNGLRDFLKPLIGMD